MLKLKNIYYHPSTSEKPILKCISLDVKRGQPLIISGASGTGKTSLVEIISGLVSPNKDTNCLGINVLDMGQRRVPEPPAITTALIISTSKFTTNYPHCATRYSN